MNIDPTVIAAWFGAIGTVLLFFFEVYKYAKDKPTLKLKIRFNQEIVDELEDGFKKNKQIGSVWTINIANNWKMPIVIKSVAVINHKARNAIITKDALSNKIQYITLEVGTAFDVIVSEEMLDPKDVKTVIVTSGVGTQYKKRIYFWMKK